MSKSQAFQCGKQLVKRWGITLDEAQLFLINQDYWNLIHRPNWNRA